VLGQQAIRAGASLRSNNMRQPRNLVPVTRPVADASVEPALHVWSTPIDDVTDLLALLPGHQAVAWLRDGEGLIGWGEAARYEVAGSERFSRANRWWARVCDTATIDDAVMRPGSGPVAFASFAFDSDPGSSVLVVPEVVVGRRDGKAWLTVTSTSRQRPDIDLAATTTVHAPGVVAFESSEADLRLWESRVAEAIERIGRGELDKVVLARDVVATADQPIDVRHLLTRLSAEYPQCWAFSVDGLIGATPELLIRREGDRVTSRVLAGTIRSDSDSSEDGRLAQALLGSGKDQEEHRYAVSSVAAALATHCTDLEVPSQPSVLRLANVQHLATDVTGLLVHDTSVLALAASLHPTAAVCGTPTERAFAMIRSIELIERGRYAGPVGWIDANGDGEFGIALRCGQIDSDDPQSIRLFAGCGIVAGSDPQSEGAESEAKLLAMRHALSS